MILGYETIISKISSSVSMDRSEIESKINQKVVEYQDLISKEGAAHMVANDLNVKLFDSSPKILKIKDITSGLNSITLLGKVVNTNSIRTFQKGTRQGRVANILLGDETGTIRVVIWDERILGNYNEIKEGMIIKVLNAYSKENNGYKELHLGSRSQLEINPPNESISDVRLDIISSGHSRKEIQSLSANDFAEVNATVVQIFEPKFYNACPVCNKKTLFQDNIDSCSEHGTVSAKKVLIVNIYMDDGTGNIRAVAFRENAEKLVGKDKDFESVKKDILGKQFLIKGKVVKNDMFARNEFMISGIQEASPENIIAEMETV